MKTGDETAPARRLPAYVASAVLGFLLAVAGTAGDGWPLPAIHDEFSMILGGETLASGRLANPQPEQASAFEAPHVLTSPRYVTKYLPGHPLFLAAGTVLGGGPRLGQWLSFAFLGCALLYCLRAWFSPRATWVIWIGALLALADTVWASGYMGAGTAAAGSALLIGAWRRLRDRPALSHGAIAGLGAVVLVLTRPWEGVWVGLPIAIAMLPWLRPGADGQKRRAAGAAIGVLAIGLAGLALYNVRTTGSPVRTAYMLYEANAGGAPPFIWQDPPAPRSIRRSTDLRDAADLQRWKDLRECPACVLVGRYRSAAGFYGGPVFHVAVLLIPLGLTAANGILLAALLGGVGATAVASFFTPNYLGPALPALLVLAGTGGTRLASRISGAPRVALAGAAVALLAWRIVSQGPVERLLYSPERWTVHRQAVIDRLETTPGQHLVLVRYTASYGERYEWVQNGADLAGARTLWAHDRGAGANAALLAAFPGRQAWLLTLGEGAGFDRPVPWDAGVNAQQ